MEFMFDMLFTFKYRPYITAGFITCFIHGKVLFLYCCFFSMKICISSIGISKIVQTLLTSQGLKVIMMTNKQNSLNPLELPKELAL